MSSRRGAAMRLPDDARSGVDRGTSKTSDTRHADTGPTRPLLASPPSRSVPTTTTTAPPSPSSPPSVVVVVVVVVAVAVAIGQTADVVVSGRDGGIGGRYSPGGSSVAPSLAACVLRRSCVATTAVVAARNRSVPVTAKKRRSHSPFAPGFRSLPHKGQKCLWRVGLVLRGRASATAVT